MMDEILILYVTHPNLKVAHELSSQLIYEKLVGCSNVFPISSCYFWNDVINRDDEFVTLLKTEIAKETELVSRIEALHSYEIPCILRFRVPCNTAYANWIKSQTQS